MATASPTASGPAPSSKGAGAARAPRVTCARSRASSRNWTKKRRRSEESRKGQGTVGPGAARRRAGAPSAQRNPRARRRACRPARDDQQSVVEGKSVSVGVDRCGRRNIKEKHLIKTTQKHNNKL